MPQTTTNFSWITSLTAEAQFQDLWWDQLNVVLVDQDTELFKTKIKGKETIFIPAAAMSPTSTGGCANIASTETTAGRPDIISLDFDASTDEFAQFQIAFPKSWDEGTVTFQVQSTTAGTGAGTVEWDLQAVAVGDDDSIDVAYGTLQTVTQTMIATAEDMNYSSESSAITIAGTPAEDQMCFFRLGRDATNDTHAVDAQLIGIKLFFTTDGRNDD